MASGWRLAAGLLLGLGLLRVTLVGPVQIEGTREDVVAKGSPELENRNGVLWFRGAPFTGSVVEHDGLHRTSRTPYLSGREHGLVESWYPSGALRSQRRYRFGRREGTHRGFYENGQL